MNYFEFHINDYLGDTRHLTPMQHGVYFLLLLRYYATEKPLPSDRSELARVCGIKTRWEREALEIVVRDFFQDDGVTLTQPRVLKQLAAFSAFQSKQSQNAKKRWENKEATKPAHMPDDASHYPLPTTHLPIEEKRGAQAPRPRFARPALEEVQAYCNERKNFVNPQAFINFYTAKGWMVGKSPMKDWKAAVRTWEQRHTAPTSQPAPVQKPPRACGVCGATGSMVETQGGPRCITHMHDY